MLPYSRESTRAMHLFGCYAAEDCVLCAPLHARGIYQPIKVRLLHVRFLKGRISVRKNERKEIKVNKCTCVLLLMYLYVSSRRQAIYLYYSHISLLLSPLCSLSFAFLTSLHYSNLVIHCHSNISALPTSLLLFHYFIANASKLLPASCLTSQILPHFYI